jgi:glycosyltransferase involved in cell wall biosynthesis
MPAALAASDIAAFPVTQAEAFGRGAVEAQAMGVPVIASNLGGFTETVVEGETGLLTPPGVPVALAAALEQLINVGPQARAALGAKARERARRLYSVATLQSATLAVYEQLLKAKSARGAARGRGEMVL